MSPIFPLFLLLPVWASAAATPAASSAEVVQLEVSVEDQRGRLVSGLDPDRFTVVDSGVKREIADFQEVPAARVVVVMDTSASMERSFWSARRAAWDLLQGLDPRAEVAVARCAHNIALVSRFSRDRADASAALASLRLSEDEGSTLLACIGEAAGLLSGHGQAARRAVALITDGQETSLSGGALESAVERLGRRLEQDGVELHVLGQDRQSWLAELAAGGSWRAPWQRKDAVGGLARQLGAHYRLGFHPGFAAPGRRPVQVQVRGTGLVAHAPTRYVVSRSFVPGAPD